MFPKQEVVAMLLAGGQGSRLGVLTKKLAGPAVPYGGKYRIIDFPLSNCVNSGIDTVGVLTQYQPLVLNEYIGNGQPWDLDGMNSGVQVLPPYHAPRRRLVQGDGQRHLSEYPDIERYHPDYVDHPFGRPHLQDGLFQDDRLPQGKRGPTGLIAVIDVPLEEASRFGILNTNEDGSIYEFDEKPAVPKSTKAYGHLCLQLG